ncbi:MAG TPA: strawberry notch C-terminal domain-containing protein [Pyrinomonadaceae bacterium]|nr:strawberry notch C-terminal domain-containing protein [Pyrinomonadaceae bacterium]
MEFHNTIDRGGVGSMEMVARDMKAAGMYCSRSLSMRGVDYRSVHHALTPEQKEIYNVAARAWAEVARSFDDALNETNANGKAKGMARARLYSGQQMFFRQLMTAMKVPALIAETERVQNEGSTYVDPKTGESKQVPAQVVIGVIGTGEARTKEQVSKAMEFGLDLDELDFSPKQILLNVVEAAYPVKRFTEEYDPMSGQTIKVPVVDSDGKHVESIEAIEMRDALLHDLEQKVTLPDNPLDQIVNYFGESAVAEITGRNKRIIIDPENGTRSYVKRAREGVAMDKASQDEMNAFQASRKGTAIISQSASTGISLHAELKPILADYVGRRKLTEERAAEIQNEWNQNADVEAVREMLQVHDLDIFRRVHITLETAWSADTQMQTFGRTHRSNELLPPEYVLMSTDLGGEKRFLATIAKRLGSLGALTKGDREQAGGGNLLDYDFENKYGMEAAKKIITMMRDGKPAFMTMLPLEPLTGNERGGLELLYTMGIAKREGNLYTVPDKVLEDLEVSKFLNRVLMLDVETQNTVFDGFVQEMEALITHDKELGLFDEGVKDIEGTNIRLADEPRVVSTDKMSGAETLYYKVNADTPTAPVTLRQIEERNRVVRVGGLEMNTQNNKGVFYQQRNSKNIIYTEYVSTRAEATTGAMVKHYKFARPSGWQTSLLTEKDLLDKYVPVQLHERREFSEETVMEVKEWWNKEVSDTPPSRVQDYHLIAGAVLPVWQRLAQTNEKGDQMSLRTVRIETEEGERIVGVEIPARQINRVLRDLGVQQSFKTPEEVFDAVLETKETIDLVGGIRLRPTFLKKQPAIEIMNLSLFQKNEFQNYGAQKEIISFSDKYYVPTDKTKGVEVLAKVLERYPAVDKTEERVQAQTVIKENKTAGLSGVINKAIENLSVKNFGDGALAKVSEKSTGFAAQAAFLRDKQLSQYWWMMTAEANDKGQIKINAATYEFIRVAYRQTFHEDIKTFDGLFDDADRADRFMQTMDYMEENCGIYCDAVASITKTIAEARNAREDKALIFLTDDKLSTRQHEESHAVSYSASAGKTLIERHARFDELVATEAYTISKPFLANLRGTDDDGLLVEETFAYISSGEGWKIGLLPDDIADFGTLWYKSFAEKNGDISILKFKEMTDESKQIRDRAYREIKLEQSERERLARNGFTAGSERGGVVGNAEEGTRYARGDFGAESDARQGAEYLENRIAEIKSSLLFGYQMEEENSFDLHPAIYTEVSKDLLAAREFIEVELPELKSEGISEDVYLERLKEFNFEPHTRDNQIEAFYKTSYENIYVTTTGKAVIFEGEETLPASDDDILAAAVEKQLLSEGVSNSSETELFLPEQEDVMPENTIRQQFAENPIIETAFSKGERVGAGALYKLSTEIDSEEISEILEDYGINTPEGNDVKVLAAYVEKYPQATGELISFAADRDLIRDERYDEMSAEQAFDSSEARFEMYARQVSRELARPINSEKGAALYKQSETESTGKIKGDEIFTDFQSIFVKAGLENALEAKEATIDFETPGRYPARFQLEIGEDEIKFSEKRVIEGKRSEFADPERGITFGKNERGNFQYTGSFERDEQGEIAGSEYDKAAGMDDILRWQYLGNNLVVTRIDADEKLASDVNTINRSNLEKYLSRHLGDELLAEIKAGTAAFEAQKFENNLKNERLKVSASIGEKEETKEISFADLERMRSAIARSNVANAKKTGILEMISEDEKKPLDAVEKQQYAKELAKAGQMQKPWIAALNDAVSAETARLAELRSESLAGLKEAMAETKEVAKQAGIEDTSEIKPILPPEKIWLEQIKAVKRSDAETFTRLEAINQAAGIPRPNDVYARLRGMETIAAMNAREENRNLVEWVGQKKLHDKTVLINVREEKGALKLEAWRVKDAEQKHDQLTADAKENTKRADSERDQAVQKALQPLINKINPFSPMQGQAGWLTRPKQTLNVHINPIEVIKQDAAIQVVRAVAGYIEHKGKADQMSKLAEAAIKEAAFLKDELASDIVANAGKLTEAVAAAVNAEEALRKDLKMNPSINAELLETPERGLTDAELRQIGHGAMETGDVNQTREYLDLVKKDAEFAESVGETKETLTTKSLLSEARAAWQARQTIESVKLRDDGSVDVEINPAQFSQAVEAIETADVIEEVQSVVASKSIVSTLSLEEVAQAERFLNANNQIAESLNSQVADLGQNLMRELQPPMTETEQKIFKEMAFSESTHRQFEEIRDQGIISDIRAQQAEFATQNNIQFQQTAHNMTVTNPNDMLEEKELKFWQDDRTQREDKIAREKAVLRMSMADSEKAAQDAADLEEIELLEKVEAAEIPLAKTLV